MSAQHTPGPWFIWQELALQREGYGAEEISDELMMNADHSIYAGTPEECTRGRLKGYRAHVCDVDADSFDFDDDEDVCRATALANARLIAAAPELLDLLNRAVRRLEIAHANGDTIMREWIVEARAAIAKVEGEKT